MTKTAKPAFSLKKEKKDLHGANIDLKDEISHKDQDFESFQFTIYNRGFGFKAPIFMI